MGKDIKLLIAYSIYGISVVCICLWALLRDSGYPISCHAVDTEEQVAFIEYDTTLTTNPIDFLIHLHEVGAEDVTDALVLDLLDTLGVEHPHIVIAQMKLESGNYLSSVATNNNNLLGMKHPTQRATTSTGSKNGYASYRNWAYGVLDYAIWQRRYASGLTEDEYYSFLSRRYAEDINYCSKVRKIADKFKKNNKQ